MGDTFSETTSAVMSHDGEPNFTFHVFDRVLEADFVTRFTSLTLELKLPKFCKVVEHHYVTTTTELEYFYAQALFAGHEGVMLRSFNGRYKFGRSTVREGILLKLKPFADSEAKIVGFEELMHNDNEAVTNELGRTARSSCKDGKTPAGTLGKFIVVGVEEKHFGGVEFPIGTGVGLTAKMRQDVWDNQADYLGKILKFRYQEIGSIDSPRIPTSCGFRDTSDMS
ncbi:MAG: hypothetical protein WKF77_01135 [Planctomycetaceae bacterium]